MPNIQMTEDLLDNLARFRAELAETLRLLEIPNDLKVSLRQSIDRAIVETVDRASGAAAVVCLQQTEPIDDFPA